MIPKFFFALITLGAIFTSSIAPEAHAMNPQEIKQGYQQHASMVQLHRWYLIYEEPRYGMQNQLGILADDIRVASGLGEANGHDEYAERVNSLPTTWKNAHDVKTANFSIDKDGSISLTADIIYLNQGLLEDGAVRKAELTYTMALMPTDSVLPKFTTIEIKQNSEGTSEKFASKYAQNRLLSLVHYWLALIEDPARDTEPVREILADEFRLNFSSGAISDFDGFKAWLAGPGSEAVASTHVISNFTQKSIGDNRYAIEMDLNWNGLLPNDDEYTAKTRHSWLVVDDPTERFARIESISVDVVNPLSPRDAE